MVKTGGIRSRNGISLKPVTEMSSEHDKPLARKAAIAPSARRSFAARIAVVSGDVSRISRAQHRTRSNPARQAFANRGRNDCDVLNSVEVVEYLNGELLGVVSWQFPLPTILSDQETLAHTAAACMLEKVE